MTEPSGVIKKGSGPPPDSQEGRWRDLGGTPGTLLGPWWVHSLPSLVTPEASRTLIFLYNFSEIYWALLMARIPEIKTAENRNWQLGALS